MDVNNWELRHQQLAAAHDADQAERRAMLSGIASVEEAGFDERISGETENEMSPSTLDEPDWEQRDTQTENLVGGALEELERRQMMMGQIYPFDLKDGGLEYRGSATGIYEFCLSATLNVTGKVANLPRPTVVFEWLARDILKLYIGRGSQGFRTGWPSDKLENRGRGTLQLFKQLNELSGAFEWKPKSYLPAHPKPRHLKDAGLDVVVWKPFPDDRGCCLFALGQCACGRTDWQNKLEDLSLKRLRNWFEDPTAAEPLRCFLVPFHIPNRAHLHEVSSYAGVTLDRARLAMLAEQDQDAIEAVMQDALIDYHEAAFALAEVHAVA